MAYFRMRQIELISIIIPVYNVEEYLPRCLETIAEQSYRNLEIILVDDGSTDGSGAICDEFVKNDDRARVIHQRNQGQWAARNVGLRVAHGIYVMFIDGDDYLHHDYIRIMHESITQGDGFDMAITGYKETTNINENVSSPIDIFRSKISPADLIEDIFNAIRFDWQTVVVLWNKLYRAELIRDIWFNQYLIAEDLDFNLRVFTKASNIVYIDAMLYFYMQRSNSKKKKKKHNIVDLQCVTDSLYNNYYNLPSTLLKSHGHLFLRKLYVRTAFLKARMIDSNDRQKWFAQCQKYEKTTRKAYWLNKHINIIEKIGVTILLRIPRLTRWLMKVTKNY